MRSSTVTCLKYHHGRNNKLMILSPSEIKAQLFASLQSIGSRKRILLIPPDFTRYHSYAGQLTEWVWEYYGDAIKDILPALGTHSGMTEAQIKKMFGAVPLSLFRVHDWRNDVVTIGEVPASFINEVTEGKLNSPWPVQVNRLLLEGDYDLILSIGQVVPHEVVGMANHNKNVFVGTGGPEGINKSHFVGAVYGMERMMGRASTPVRKIFDYGSDHFATDLPIYYLLTVVTDKGVSGLFSGFDKQCFLDASEMALEKNFIMLDNPIKKAVVFLDPEEFKSTWLGNKSIYRTRMAMADEGELIVLAPGLREFGEDKEIDRLIRKYGYNGTKTTLESVDQFEELKNNLSAAAHLIHGSSEGRFSIRYCPGKGEGMLSREEIESVGFLWGDLDDYLEEFNVSQLNQGYNQTPDGEDFYFIKNPALGLWSSKDRFTI